VGLEDRGNEALGGLASSGCCGPGRPTRAGKYSEMECPTPRGGPAVFAGARPQGCQDQYLSSRGAIFNSILTTSSGVLSAIRRMRDSRLCGLVP